jgi:type III secretion protein F
MAITYSSITAAVTPAMQSVDNNLQSELDAISQKADPTPEDLMTLQVDSQQWSMVAQIGSTINKDLGDTLKGVIDKTS